MEWTGYDFCTQYVRRLYSRSTTYGLLEYNGMSVIDVRFCGIEEYRPAMQAGTSWNIYGVWHIAMP